MKNILNIFLILLLIKWKICEISYKTEVNLLKLSEHWEGNGVSFLYPNKIKLLSSKLNSQIGLIQTSGKLIGGQNWKLDINLNFDCKKNFLKEENCGIGIWIGKQKQIIQKEIYNFENNFSIYGGTKNIDGIIILISGKTLYTNILKTQNLEREEIIKKSKICKINPDFENNYFLRVKYTGKDILGIYIIDKKNLKEQICYQYISQYNFDDFYLGISGSDWKGNCSASIDQLKFFSSYKLNFVKINQKIRGDTNLCFFNEKELKTSNFLDNWKKNFDYQKSVNENARILSKKILEFADKDPKEFLRDIKNKLKSNENSLDEALEVIKNEAYILQNLGDFLISTKNSKRGDLEEIYINIFDWIEQLEESFFRVDFETDELLKKIENVDLEFNLKDLLKNSDDVILKMGSVLKKIRKVNDEKVNFPKRKDFKKMDMKLKNLKNNEIKNIKGNIINMRNIGIFIISGFGFLILCLFLSVFFNIRKVNQNKRYI